VDRAIAINPKLEAFLNQQREETTTIADGYKRLAQIIAEADAQV
jgi:flagellum-specific ATP synthase